MDEQRCRIGRQCVKKVPDHKSMFLGWESIRGEVPHSPVGFDGLLGVRGVCKGDPEYRRPSVFQWRFISWVCNGDEGGIARWETLNCRSLTAEGDVPNHRTRCRFSQNESLRQTLPLRCLGHRRRPLPCQVRQGRAPNRIRRYSYFSQAVYLGLGLRGFAP